MRFIFTFLILCVASLAMAQVEEFSANIGGAQCDICLKSSQVMLSQLPFVREVRADTANRVLWVGIKPGQQIAVKDVLDRMQAASPGTALQAEMTASGRIAEKDGKYLLIVPGQRE